MKKTIVNYLLSKDWFLLLVKQRFFEAIESINYNSFGNSCGLEDRYITDRYQAMEYGWEIAIDVAIEAIENVD